MVGSNAAGALFTSHAFILIRKYRSNIYLIMDSNILLEVQEVKTKIREVEADIKMTVTEIEDASREIKALDSQIAQPEPPADIQDLRRKQEQLREDRQYLCKKEEQLRNKEEQLRKKEKQLRRKEDELREDIKQPMARGKRAEGRAGIGYKPASKLRLRAVSGRRVREASARQHISLACKSDPGVHVCPADRRNRHQRGVHPACSVEAFGRG